jgi:hypothetical protein
MIWQEIDADRQAHTENTVSRTGVNGIHGQRYRKGKAGANEFPHC